MVIRITSNMQISVPQLLWLPCTSLVMPICLTDHMIGHMIGGGHVTGDENQKKEKEKESKRMMN